MRFSVSVPVLSVQITSVEPSVSTALRRLTSAPRRASSRTATASASVITGSSPSGTLPSSRPTAKTMLFLGDRPAPKIATGTNATAIAIAIAAINQATLRTCVSSGLGSSLTRSDNAAMRPSSVRIPVANTTPRACPPVALVPLKSRSCAAIRATLASIRSAERSTGADSPLSVERSTSTAPEIKRMSAAMRSPSSTSTMSPGTSSTAVISCEVRSRSTRAFCGRNCAKASTARSACICWIRANSAFSAITSSTAMATVSLPTANDSAAASHSSSASGWLSWRASSAGHFIPPRRCSSFGPYCRRRRWASAPESPCSELRRSRISNSTCSVGSIAAASSRLAGAWACSTVNAITHTLIRARCRAIGHQPRAR